MKNKIIELSKIKIKIHQSRKTDKGKDKHVKIIILFFACTYFFMKMLKKQNKVYQKLWYLHDKKQLQKEKLIK